jgi:hypothetical protein
MKLVLLTLCCVFATLTSSQAGKKDPAAKAEHTAKLEKEFAALDKNSDGQISKEEFVKRGHKKDTAGKKGKKGKKGTEAGKKGKKGKKKQK